MPDKPPTAAGYPREHLALVEATCLYVATKFGDLMDELVVVGGLVPSLLVRDQMHDPHVGTRDLDLGLDVALLEESRYRTLTARLRGAGFHQDTNEEGNPTRQRWTLEVAAARITVDFLIAPTLPGDRGGKLRNLEPDFAAIIAPGLHLAFQDRRRIELSGQTIRGEKATRPVWVAGPGAFVVLKALAFDSRGENKDAYDLFYVLAHYGSGIEEVAEHLRPLLANEEARRACDILARDFLDPDLIGPRRVAEFLGDLNDDDTRADVVGLVRELLRRVAR